MDALTVAMLNARNLKGILNFAGMGRVYQKWNDSSKRNLLTLIADSGAAGRSAFPITSRERRIPA